MTGMQIFHQGGFIMYPLLVFSIIVWTVGLYKAFFLRGFAREFEKVGGDMQTALSAGRTDEARGALKLASPLVARPHQVVLDGQQLSKEELQERLNRRLAETNSGLKKHLWLLGTVASSAPFVGLFGTVVGIMESFKAIGTSGKSGFSVVAAGISEALIATAAGIIVAVIAVLFYNYLQTRVNALAQAFRHNVEDTADLVGKRQG